jgi:rhodanese-related sulfurtransferase
MLQSTWFSLVLLMAVSCGMEAQYPKDAKCIQQKFDQKVNEYLNYSIPVIDVDKASKEKDQFIFIDAREIEEFETSHIKDAIWLGYDQPQWQNIKHISKNQKIIVYCSIGYRSEKIGEKLKKMGYVNVYNLYGSIFEWINRNNTVFSHSKKTNYIHTYNKNWSKWVSGDNLVKVW